MDTLEEVKEILRELAISQKETHARFKETDALLKETDALLKETVKESADRSAMIDAQLTENSQLIKELTLSQKEHSCKLATQSKQIGGIGNGFGSFIEGLAYPSLRKILLKEYGIDNTAANFVQDFPDGRQVEFDAFGFTNGTVNNAAIVEVKSALQSKHIYRFREMLERFRLDFPNFADRHLYGIMASPGKVSKELRDEIFANGLHLARIHDEVFDFEKNPEAVDWNNR